MPQAARLTDMNSGHDACAPVPLIEGSDTVLVNGLKLSRLGDKCLPHGCKIHGVHSDIVSKASSTVFANGKGVARVGDQTGLATIVIGSSNVQVGG